jgi:hypothetical protein
MWSWCRDSTKVSTMRSASATTPTTNLAAAILSPTVVKIWPLRTLSLSAAMDYGTIWDWTASTTKSKGPTPTKTQGRRNSRMQWEGKNGNLNLYRKWRTK